MHYCVADARHTGRIVNIEQSMKAEEMGLGVTDVFTLWKIALLLSLHTPKFFYHTDPEQSTKNVNPNSSFDPLKSH